MIVLIVLFGAWILFRAVGAFGVSAFGSWHDSCRFALAAMFVFTGISHFAKTRHDMARMVPKRFPHPMLMVYLTGVFELLGAAGLIVPLTRIAASAALIVMLLCLFPANIRAACEGITIAGRRATPLLWRTPMQVLFIGLLWWAGLR